MCNRIKALAIALIASLSLTASSAWAQELNSTGTPEFKEGVEVGTTSTYHTDSVVPVDQGVTEAQELASTKVSQKDKADQLKNKDPYGLSLTILSMLIVILALVILSILFLGFGRISSTLQRQRKKEAHGPKHADHETHNEDDSGEVIAAIAAALAEHYSGKHDMEDYILTIRSMKRSYSPWNSKIYNLRVLPQVKH